MDTSKVEAMLERYPTIDKEIQQAWDKIQIVKERIKDVEEIKATRYSGMPHGTETSDLSNKIVQIEELVERDLKYVEKRYELFMDLREKVDEGMDRLREIERRIIKLHFFELDDMESVARKVNYTREHTYAIMSNALKKFE